MRVNPEPNGLRVLFILRPALYFGLYRFPGASQFSYTRLLQAASYPRQEPYTAGQVGEAQSGLLAFFHQTGYFEATVSPQVEIDKAQRVVNVIFHIDLKRRAKFGNVSIQGIPPEQAEKLQSGLRSWRMRLRRSHIKPGITYSSRRVDAALRYLQNQMGKRHYLAARVQLASARYDEDSNRADLNFRINPGPVIQVSIVGAHLRDSQKKKLIPIFQENAVDRDLVYEGEQNLASYFESKGYFDAKVSSSLQRRNGGATIVYKVEKGPRGKVKSIEFQGNRQFSDDDLKQHVAVATANPLLFFFSHGKFSDQLLASSISNLSNLYHAAGFGEVKITPHLLRQRGDLRLIFQVDEGALDTVASLRMEGNQSFTESELSPKGLELKPGGPYSPELLNKDRDQITAVYLDRGFLNVVFRSRVSPVKGDPHRFDVYYSIEEGPPVFTAQVEQIGGDRTHPRLVSRTVNIKVGKPLSQTALLRGESQLYALGIFDWASVDTRRAANFESNADVLVKLHESRPNTITYGFGFSVIRRGGSVPGGTVAVPGLPPVALPSNFQTSEETFWGPLGSIEYSRRNFLGRAQTVTFGLYGARLDQHASIAWLDPSFRYSVWSASVNLSADRNQENPLYTAQIEQAGLQFQRYMDAAKTKSVFFRYNFSHTILSNLLIPGLVLPQDQNVQLSTLSASFVRDTRDDILDAHKGIYESFELDFNPSWLGSSASFGRFLGQTAYYRPVFGGSSTWANSIRLGAEVSFEGQPIPISATFFSGGGSTLRGFPLNGAGPQRAVPVCNNPADPSTCTNITVPVGGPQLLILNSELRFPLGITPKLKGAAFYDGGNVYGHLG
ncbi:MAG TPA: POTRA domain-containing protein, partial [Terriglobales bacterium]|nr:POTRA domain-containing protein [Terriglobales bacterium]